MVVVRWLLKSLLYPFVGWNRDPVLFRAQTFNIVYFGVFAALATYCGILISAFYLYLKGVDLGVRAWFLYVPVVCAIWGSARLGHLVALGRKFFEAPATFLGETRFYVQGAIFGLFITVLILARPLDISMPVLLDSLAYGGLFALFAGRLGCYNYGCCYGRSTSMPWGVVYHHPESKVLRIHPESKGRCIHPTQLYTALLNLTAFFVATIWIGFSPRDGALSVYFLLYHGLARLFIDRYRSIDLFEHRKGRWLPNVPLLTSCLGLALIWIGPYLSPDFLNPNPIPMRESLSFPNCISFLVSHPRLQLVALVSSSILFLGYGVHGKTLGTFAKLRKTKG